MPQNNTHAKSGRHLQVACLVAGLLLMSLPELRAQFSYTSTNGTVTITGYSGSESALTIPSSILVNGMNLPVTDIGSNAFTGSTLTSVTIPSSVTSIGFQAFGSTLLNSVTIPASVSSIGYAAFADCSSLTSIAVNPGNPYFAGSGGVLFNKNLTTLVQCPAGIVGSYSIPASVTQIDELSFAGCYMITSVTIPSSVTKIGDDAFAGCGISSISIPSSVTSIGNGVFLGFTMTAINVNSSNPDFSSVAGVLFNKNQTELLEYPQGKAGASYTIPSSVTSIATVAFAGCSGLSTVILPSDLRSIGVFAFSQAGLTGLAIPKAVTNIESQAFAGCMNLSSISVDPGNPDYSGVAGVLFNKNGTALIQYPSGNPAGFYTVPGKTTNIEDWAFANSSSLTNVTIGSGVSSIGDDAFGWCTALASLYFQGNAPSVTPNAFAYAGNATVYYLPGTSGWGPTFGGLQTAIFNAPIPSGSLQVTITPSGAVTAGAQWSVDGGIPQPSGATVLGLSVGPHTVTFSVIPGWPTPPIELISINPDTTTIATGSYTQVQTGSLQVTISPAAAISAGAQWQVDGGALQISGAIVTNISSGNHTVSFTAISGWLAPTNQTVSILANSTVTALGTYAQLPPTNYLISLSTSPSDAGVVSGGGTFLSGTSQTVTAVASSGYIFVDWTQDGTAVSTQASYTFAVSSNRNLVAEFTCSSINFQYVTNGGTITITGYSGCDGAVAIPGTLNGLAVTQIGAWAFANAALTSILLPNTLTDLGDYSFYLCGNLSSILIPASVTNIGEFALSGCPNMSSINVDAANAVYQSEGGVLYNKNNTTLVAYPPGLGGFFSIPSGIQSIGNGAFAWGATNLIAVTIPNGLTNIGEEAFTWCIGLTNLLIPNSVTTIGGGAFDGCYTIPIVTIPASVIHIGSQAFSEDGMSAIIVDPGNPSYSSLDGILFNKDYTILIQYPPGRPQKSYAIPGSVNAIGDYAFGDTLLTNVTIPQSLTNIGAGAFWSSELNAITIPNGVTIIGGGAFAWCSLLTSVYFEGNAPTPGLFYNDMATIYYLPGANGWTSTFDGLPTALWLPSSPLILSGNLGPTIQSNRFSFTVGWAMNTSVVMEACTNLANPMWLPLQTNAMVGGVANFTDPARTIYSTRFYRVRKQ